MQNLICMISELPPALGVINEPVRHSFARAQNDRPGDDPNKSAVDD
jgi:hypothetical protein